MQSYCIYRRNLQQQDALETIITAVNLDDARLQVKESLLDDLSTGEMFIIFSNDNQVGFNGQQVIIPKGEIAKVGRII